MSGWVRRHGRWVGLGLGLALFIGILLRSDLGAVWGLIRDLHWRLAFVFLFYLLIFGLDTLGWKFAMRPRHQRLVPWDRLFRARLAGEAVNYVTPAASIGGEPVKAVLLSRRHGIPMAAGVASVVVAKTTFSFSMLLFVVVGLALAAATQPIPGPLLRWIGIVLPVLSLLVAAFVGIQFLQPFRRGLSLLAGLSPWLNKLSSRTRRWDRSVSNFYRHSPGSVFWSTAFHFLGWVAGALEVYLILLLLNAPVTWPTAFSIEALWVLLRSGAFFIPGSLGASEGFLLLICSGLGMSSVVGLALGLIRRVREIAWMGLGLLEFAREG